MRLIAMSLLGLALLGGHALAADYEVKMLNRGETGVMVFEPALVEVAPGDSVTFVATDISHNAETIEGMLPEGAEPFVGSMNEDITVTFDEPGVYGVKCRPHYGMGMVALVVVGEPTNIADARSVQHPGKAKPAFETLLDQIETKQSAK